MKHKRKSRGAIFIDGKVLSVLKDMCKEKGFFIGDAAEEAILQWMERNTK